MSTKEQSNFYKLEKEKQKEIYHMVKKFKTVDKDYFLSESDFTITSSLVKDHVEHNNKQQQFDQLQQDQQEQQLNLNISNEQHLFNQRNNPENSNLAKNWVS